MNGEVLTRAIALSVIVILLGYASQLLFASVVEAEAAHDKRLVEVFDAFDPSKAKHRLSGIIMLPSACHSVTIKTKQLGPSAYHVYFSSFGETHGCEAKETPYAFRTEFTAPIYGVEFTANLDWHDLDFVIVSRAKATL